MSVIIQTLHVEGLNGLYEGGVTSVMTIKELYDMVNCIFKTEYVSSTRNYIGLGATESLGAELSFIDGEAYIIEGIDGKIKSRQQKT